MEQEFCQLPRKLITKLIVYEIDFSSMHPWLRGCPQTFWFKFVYRLCLMKSHDETFCFTVLQQAIGSTFVPLTGPSVKTNGTFLNFPAFLRRDNAPQCVINHCHQYLIHIMMKSSKMFKKWTFNYSHYFLSNYILIGVKKPQ